MHLGYISSNLRETLSLGGGNVISGNSTFQNNWKNGKKGRRALTGFLKIKLQNVAHHSGIILFSGYVRDMHSMVVIDNETYF